MNGDRTFALIYVLIGLTIGMLVGALVYATTESHAAGAPSIHKLREIHYDGAYGGWMAVCVGHSVVVSAHSSTVQLRGVSC